MPPLTVTSPYEKGRVGKEVSKSVVVTKDKEVTVPLKIKAYVIT